MRKRIEPLRQLTRTECGLCCVAMVSQYHGFTKPISYFRKILDVGRDGSSIRDIIKLFDRINIDAVTIKFSLEKFKEESKPLILIFDNKHFVVLERYKKCIKKFSICDPAIGRFDINRQELLERAGKYAITTSINKDFEPINDKEKVWMTLSEVFVNEKIKFILTVLFSLIIYSYVLIVPIIIQKFTDQLIDLGMLIWTIREKILIFILIILFIITNIIKNKVSVNLEAAIDTDLFNKVIGKIFKLPYKFFEIRNNGDLIFRLNLLNNIRTFISDIFVGGVLDIAGVVFATIYACTISSMLLFIIIIMLVGIFFVSNLINNNIVRLNYYEMSEITEITVGESEIVNSIYDIKILGIEDNFTQKLKESHTNFIKLFSKRNIWTKTNSSLLQFFQLFLPFLLLLFNMLCKDILGLTVGQIIAFYSISGILISSAISLMQKYTNIKLMKNALSRINDILLEEDEQTGDEIINKFEEIRLDNVDFAYSETSDMVLRNINLNIKRGQKIAIVGASGSGKSTLSNLILGLYQPNKGSIYINGIEQKKIKKGSISNIIGVIPQDAKLFNQSIKDNLIMKKETISHEQINNALNSVGILKDIQKMPMKVETLISEFGKNLSGGQRQRIVMARTLLKSPELIIMDEATSSLDGISEQEINGFLKQYGCTQLIISHRLSTILNADYVYVLDNGMIVEEGKLENLTKQGTNFYKLFKSQLVD